MPDNRVSASLSQADQQAVLAAIDTIRERLPFLIDLTTHRHELSSRRHETSASEL